MNKNTKRVLVIDDEEKDRDKLEAGFNNKKLDFEFTVDAVDPGKKPKQVERLLAQWKYDVIIIDLVFGDNDDAGLDLMARRMLFASCPEAVKIVVTGFATIDRCVRAMRLGAWNFIEKGQNFATRTVESAVERLKEIEEAHRQERFIFEEWLPKHEHTLQKKFPGEYVVVTGGKVIAHARTMIALGKGFPEKSGKEEKMPYILYIRKTKNND